MMKKKESWGSDRAEHFQRNFAVRVIHEYLLDLEFRFWGLGVGVGVES